MLHVHATNYVDLRMNHVYCKVILSTCEIRVINFFMLTCKLCISPSEIDYLNYVNKRGNK